MVPQGNCGRGHGPYRNTRAPWNSLEVLLTTRTVRPVHFDEHQFQHKYGRPHRYGTDSQENENAKTNNLDFVDYSKMKIEIRRYGPSSRKRATPEWALNDDLLRERIATYLENRAMIPRGEGTPFERVQ